MTEEKKRQYISEMKLCMTVLEQIADEVSKERGEPFGMIILANRYKRESILTKDEPEEWRTYCNVSFYDKDGHSSSSYYTDNLEDALYGVL